MRWIRDALAAITLALLGAHAGAAGLERLFISAPDPHPAFGAIGTRAEPLDHSVWARFLGRFVDGRHASGIHRVRYAAVDARGKADLAAYIALLERLDPRQLPRSEQMAYWINLYNALTVRVILEKPEVESIRDIRSGLFSIGPWNREVTTVNGVALSLNDIEHRVLRPIFQDRRIHFAVNCASLGCPNLRPEPFTGARLADQLDDAERAFLAHPRGVRFDGAELVLSSIFDWYGDDFASDRSGLLRYLTQRAPGSLGQRLQNFRGKLRYEYDWRLNRP